MLLCLVNVSRCLFSTTASSQRHLSAHPPDCHPERSEGSAFLRRLSSPQFRLSDCPLSAVSSQPQSSSAPLLPPSTLSFRLSTVSVTKSFTIRTHAKHTRNLFTMNTSKTKDLKPCRMNTYKKRGEGYPASALVTSLLRYVIPSPPRETFFLPPGCSPQVQENLDAASRPSRLRPSSLNIPTGTATSPRADHFFKSESPSCPRKLNNSPHLPRIPNAASILALSRKPQSFLRSTKTKPKRHSCLMSAKTASSSRRPIA